MQMVNRFWGYTAGSHSSRLIVWKFFFPHNHKWNSELFFESIACFNTPSQLYIGELDDAPGVNAWLDVGVVVRLGGASDNFRLLLVDMLVSVMTYTNITNLIFFCTFETMVARNFRPEANSECSAVLRFISI